MRRTKQVVGPNQLSLFTSFAANSRRVDNLVDRLILQAANLRYLITRTQYCGELDVLKRSELMCSLEGTLGQFRALCTELKKQSNKHSPRQFDREWLVKDYVQITDASAFPSVENLFDHLYSCQKGFSTVSSADNSLLGATGTIVDNIKTKYQNLISDNAFQSTRYKRYLYA
jgi:hypothetical protein